MQKKVAFTFVTGEDFKQTKRVWIVRPVVVGERELLCAARESGERTAVPLPGGSHRLIASRDECADRGGSGQNRSEHGRIVKD